jgi:hypothetical protein
MVSLFQGLGLAAAGAAEQFELVKKIEADENLQRRRELQAKLRSKMDSEEWYRREQYKRKDEEKERDRVENKKYKQYFSMATSLAGGDPEITKTLSTFKNEEIYNIVDLYDSNSNDISFVDFVTLGAKQDSGGNSYFDASTVNSIVNDLDLGADPEMNLIRLNDRIAQIRQDNPDSAAIPRFEEAQLRMKALIKKKEDADANKKNAPIDSFKAGNEAFKMLQRIRAVQIKQQFPSANITPDGELTSGGPKSLQEIAQNSATGNLSARELRANITGAIKLTMVSTGTFRTGQLLGMYSETSEANQERTDAYKREIDNSGASGTAQLLRVANTTLQMLQDKGNRVTSDPDDASTRRNKVLIDTLTTLKKQFSAVERTNNKPLAVVVNLQELVKTSNDFKNTSGFGKGLVSRDTPINYYNTAQGELTTTTVGEMMNMYNNMPRQTTPLVLQ